MIYIIKDDLLESKAHALVNPVNTVGVMGKGLALEFKKQYPKNYSWYKELCDDKSIFVGKVYGFYENNKLIINFPTKEHWKNPSKLEWIEKGLLDLKDFILKCNVKSIAIPALGCGNGGLDWNEILPRITDTFKDLEEVLIFVYEPNK